MKRIVEQADKCLALAEGLNTPSLAPVKKFVRGAHRYIDGAESSSEATIMLKLADWDLLEAHMAINRLVTQVAGEDELRAVADLYVAVVQLRDFIGQEVQGA